MKFDVRIEETLATHITVEANSEKEAIEIVKEQYYNEEIVLDSNDFIGTNFTASKINR